MNAENKNILEVPESTIIEKPNLPMKVGLTEAFLPSVKYGSRPINQKILVDKVVSLEANIDLIDPNHLIQITSHIDIKDGLSVLNKFNQLETSGANFVSHNMEAIKSHADIHLDESKAHLFKLAKNTMLPAGITASQTLLHGGIEPAIKKSGQVIQDVQDYVDGGISSARSTEEAESILQQRLSRVSLEATTTTAKVLATELTIETDCSNIVIAAAGMETVRDLESTREKIHELGDIGRRELEHNSDSTVQIPLWEKTKKFFFQPCLKFMGIESLTEEEFAFDRLPSERVSDPLFSFQEKSNESNGSDDIPVTDTSIDTSNLDQCPMNDSENFLTDQCELEDLDNPFFCE